MSNKPKVFSFREANRVRRYHEAYRNVMAFYRGKGLRGAALTAKVTRLVSSAHGPLTVGILHPDDMFRLFEDARKAYSPAKEGHRGDD